MLSCSNQAISHPGSLQDQPCTTACPLLLYTPSPPTPGLKCGREGKTDGNQHEAGCHQTPQRTSCAAAKLPQMTSASEQPCTM